jgi:hypothetical protein
MTSKSSERLSSRYSSKVDGDKPLNKELSERFNSLDLDSKLIQDQIEK